MKRIISLSVFILVATVFVFADKDRGIAMNQLPDRAQKFIAQHFPKHQASYAKVESDFFDKSYEVIFTDGSKIEFDSKGEWTDIDCEYSQVPDSAVPSLIKKFVDTNYKGTTILEIDRDRKDYEVKLSNGLELKFDLKFNLIKIDN